MTFDPSFNNVPMVGFAPRCITHQPDNAEWDNGYDDTKPTYLELVALDLTASGFTMRARLRQKAVQTAQDDDFAAGAARILDAVGEDREANLNPAVAVSDQYTTHFKVELEAHNTFPETWPWYARITVAIDTNDGGGWFERATFEYQVGSGVSSTSDNTWAHEQKIITVSGLILNSDIRIRLKTVDESPKTDWDTMEVTCFNKDTDGDAENGVTYNTATDSYADATPDAGEDTQPWEALEVA